MKTTIKTTTLTLASIAMFANLASAAVIRFDGGLPDGGSPNNNWTTALNWQGNTVPTAADTVRFNFSGAAGLINTSVGSINEIQIGVDENGGLTVATGGVVTAAAGGGGISGFGLGGASVGTMTINGGTATFNHTFYSGYNGGTSGTLNISSGTMRVASTFIQNFANSAFISTTNLTGGFMDVNSMTLNPGTFNVAGGTLRIRGGNFTSQVATWRTQGRMTANGGAGILYADYDAANNWTAVTAIPEPSSAVLCGLAGFALMLRRRRA